MKMWLIPIAISIAAYALTFFILWLFKFHSHLEAYASEEEKGHFLSQQKQGEIKTVLDITTATAFLAFFISENYIGCVLVFVAGAIRAIFIHSFWE